MKRASQTKVGSKKLISSKWTAVQPIDKEKHFVVIRVFERRTGESTTVHLELESILSKRVRSMPLHELSDATFWKRGWA